jgi:hypothetical protein
MQAQCEVFSRQQDLEQVKQEINTVDKYPTSARRMVLEGVQYAFEDCVSGEYHKYQVQFISMAGEMISAAQSGVMEAKAANVKTVQDLEEELQGLKAFEGDAAEKEGAARAELARQDALVKEANQRVKEHEKQHQQVERVFKDSNKQRSELEQAKQNTISVIEGIYPMIQSGGWADDETRDDMVTNVQDCLKQCGVESELVKTAPMALGKRPDARGVFDKACVDHVAEVLKKRLQSLEAQLQEGAEQATEARVEALGMWAVADMARDVQAAAESEKKTAQDAVTGTATMHKRLMNQVADREKRLSNCHSKHGFLDKKAERVAAAQAAFERLRAGEYPDPEAKEEEPADAPMEEGVVEGADAVPMEGVTTEFSEAKAEPDANMEAKEVEAPKADHRALCGA